MGDSLVIIMVVIGVLLGLKRKLIRLLMSIVVVAIVLGFTPSFYEQIGTFFAGFGLARRTADGLGFILGGLLLLIIFELLFRWAFKDTSLPRLRILDRIGGALVGVAWGIFAASVFLAPLSYMGSADATGLAALSYKAFSVLSPALHFVYRAGTAPVIDW
jgi:hypothetical protein